jgi:hypothetical protein
MSYPHCECEHCMLRRAAPGMRDALQFIVDGYDNHDVNHVDYRVKVYQVALDALEAINPNADADARERS